MKNITVMKENQIGIVAINRPPANALSQELIRELSQIFDQLAEDQDIRVILLQGEGKFFSAGADIKEFSAIQSAEDFSNSSQLGQQTFAKIESSTKPVIAVIHGAALGGGLELAMACHIRLVSNEAKLGLPELQLGLIPGFGGTIRLPHLLGPGKAAEMLFTSEPLSGIEAVQWGLANHAYPEEELFNRAKELAHKIAKKSPIALKAAIKQLQFSHSGQYYLGLEEEMKQFGVLFNTQDAQEGIQAFIEKREPKFRGK
ncbi:enoyl-CoA hydratase [Virgibacillus soli]|nr:enoyl-CoA hydratase [Virgibacillus soli]